MWNSPHSSRELCRAVVSGKVWGILVVLAIFSSLALGAEVAPPASTQLPDFSPAAEELPYLGLVGALGFQVLQFGQKALELWADSLRERARWRETVSNLKIQVEHTARDGGVQVFQTASAGSSR